jgi:hypothetical protein
LSAGEHVVPRLFLILIEKATAEIRSVDLDMAVGADFGGKKEITAVTLTVALYADAPDIPVRQKEAVGRAVGVVANGAPFEL